MITILEDFGTRKSRYNPNLAEKVNRQVELEEKREALKRKAEPKPEVQEPVKEAETNEQANRSSGTAEPTDYIFLEAKTHGPYSYPDLVVSKERSHFNENWNQAKESVKKEKGYMLTIRQFADFLSLLKSGKAVDGRGRKIDSKELERLFSNITEVKSPWRSEWLDAKFGDGEIIYPVIKKDGSLSEIKESFYRGLTQDKTPGIDLESWFKTADYQGLPTSKTKDGSLYYWSPVDGRVAWFNASSGGADLGCDGIPAIQNAGLGVRITRRVSAEFAPRSRGWGIS